MLLSSWRVCITESRVVRPRITAYRSAGDCKNNGVTLKGDTPL